jgi:hypothetical protein
LDYIERIEMSTPNIEELMALADRYATLRIGKGTANTRKELQYALQSQAERIAELERESETHAKAYGLAIVERDNLRAQLAAIAATEPVLVVEKEPDYWSGGHFHEGSKPHIKPTKVWCLPIGTQLFTRPMPAQDVNAELVDAFEHHIEQTRPIERSTIALSKYKGAKQ